MASETVRRHWHISFLTSPSRDHHSDLPNGYNHASSSPERALIILNQPFSRSLLEKCWKASKWRCCADGGANRLFDVLDESGGTALTNGFTNGDEAARSHKYWKGTTRIKYLPDLIKGDLDSLRPDVRHYYEKHGVPVVEDDDQDSTDLMKCIDSIKERERTGDVAANTEIIVLGGLTGRLDQTIHTLSLLHKLRHEPRQVFAIADENIGWVLDRGEHVIHVDRTQLGPNCGLLPVGIDETLLTTSGLKWNLTNHPSSFDGMVSTSNAVAGDEVYIKTTKPIWWCIELAKP